MIFVQNISYAKTQNQRNGGCCSFLQKISFQKSKNNKSPNKYLLKFLEFFENLSDFQNRQKRVFHPNYANKMNIKYLTHQIPLKIKIKKNYFIICFIIA